MKEAIDNYNKTKIFVIITIIIIINYKLQCSLYNCHGHHSLDIIFIIVVSAVKINVTSLICIHAKGRLIFDL